MLNVEIYLNMKKCLFSIILSLFSIVGGAAQQHGYVTGSCGHDCDWQFDGYTLTIHPAENKNNVSMNNYNTKSNPAPWKKKNLDIRKVRIEKGVTRIGDCSFYDLPNLQEASFTDNSLREIGWGAFMDCRQLRNVKFPDSLEKIGKISFANCDAMTTVVIPDDCRVGEQAFASCDNLQSIDLSPTCIIGNNAFAGETTVNGMTRHTLFTGDVVQAPAYITPDNSKKFGLARFTIIPTSDDKMQKKEYTHSVSELDTQIPEALYIRNNTYALVIGNQDYRFAGNVPFALHDANIFAKYCTKTLGIPAENVHLVENATKEMILNEELHDWLGKIPDRNQKTLIVYYAGNGLPDTNDGNKAYLLPTEVRGSNPQRGIPLDDFYRQLGDLGFNQTTVFMDASFSGLNRDGEGIINGATTSGVDAEKIALGSGNVVVFSAADGKGAALGYTKEGHGLFTYWLLKEMHDTNGIISLGTLSDRLSTNVPKSAPQIKKNARQNPIVKASDKLAPKWRSIRL